MVRDMDAEVIKYKQKQQQWSVETTSAMASQRPQETLDTTTAVASRCSR